MVIYFAKTSTILAFLPLVTLGKTTQIEPILFVSHCKRKESKTSKIIFRDNWQIDYALKSR
jgi:hypothetical protein